MLFSTRGKVRVRNRFSFCSVGGYSYVFTPPSVVIVTLPQSADKSGFAEHGQLHSASVTSTKIGWLVEFSGTVNFKYNYCLSFFLVCHALKKYCLIRRHWAHGAGKTRHWKTRHFEDFETLGTLLFRLGWDGRHMNGGGVLEWGGATVYGRILDDQSATRSND